MPGIFDRGLGKIPSPLEVVDAGADIVNQVFRLPFRLTEGVAKETAMATGNLIGDIKNPADFKGTPKPPDVLVKPVFSGVAHIVGGAIGVVKGGLDGVVDTFEGIKTDVDARLRK